MLLLETHSYCHKIAAILQLSETVSEHDQEIPQLQTADKVRKRAKIRNRYNQAPHLTQDPNGKVTMSQLDITNESQEVSPFPAQGIN